MTAPALLVERLDRLLPQTQCGQCGFDGCRPYAEAMAMGEADIDRCPPGGDAGARALAHATGRVPRPYDRARGLHKPPLVALVASLELVPLLVVELLVVATRAHRWRRLTKGVTCFHDVYIHSETCLISL